jgi:ADP-heptose:LPS heptosyltransferase
VTRALVVRLDNAGDVLLAGPAVRAVAAHAMHVTMLAGPRGAEAARLLPGVDEVVVLDAPWIALEPRTLDRAWVEAAVERLAGTRCDVAVILTSSHQSSLPTALLLRMAGVARIGGISVDHPGSLLDVRLGADLDVHEVVRALAVAQACGFSLPAGDDGRLAVLRPRGDERALLRPGYVLLHPGASAPARRWHLDGWSALAAALCSAGYGVAVSGDAAERSLARSITAAAPAAADVCGVTDLAALVELVAHACCVVAGNTGPAHVAAAVGTPVVSLYAPTVPAARWHPWRVPHILLGDQRIECAGCRAVHCPVAGHPCIDDVESGEVMGAVRALTTGATEHAAVPA